MKFETRVKDILLRVHNVKSFRFPRPPSFDYKPGQFMYIALKRGDKEMLKHFTISSSPTESDHIEFTKKLTGHDFSNALDALKTGDPVEINGPFGFFTFEGEKEKVGMLTGGIGITPLRSICRYCTDKGHTSDIVLIYGNHCEKDIVFQEELEKMQDQNTKLRIVFTLSEPSESWMMSRGRISANMIKKEIPDFMERDFYVCGPPGIVRAMEELLKELGLSPNQIIKEEFPGYE